MTKDEKNMILECWSVTQKECDPYVPPEARNVYLQGSVFGHPKFPDGTFIRTSHIVDVDDRMVTTARGSVYTLGAVSQEYLEWCERVGVEIPKEGGWIRVR